MKGGADEVSDKKWIIINGNLFMCILWYFCAVPSELTHKKFLYIFFTLFKKGVQYDPILLYSFLFLK